MRRRLFLFTLVAILAAMSVGLLTNTPTQAAPAEAQINANLFPKDTAILANIRLANLDQSIKDISALYEKVTGEKMPPVFADFNTQLTKLLGRDASFEKDIQPLLGDYLSIGARFTDEQFAEVQKALDAGDLKGLDAQKLQLTPLVVLAVKNDAGVTKFLTEVFDKVKAQGSTDVLTSRKEGAFTLWEQGGNCANNCLVLVQGKGYIVGGTTLTINDWLAWNKARTPALNTDANFTKVTNALKPNSSVTVYISQRFYYYTMVSGQSSMMSGMMAGVDSLPTAASAVEVTPTATPSGAVAEATAEVTAEATEDSAASTPEGAPTTNAQAQAMKLTIGVLRAMNGQAIAIRPVANNVLTLDVVQSVDQTQLSTLWESYGLPTDIVNRLMRSKISNKLAGQISDKAVAVLDGQGLGDLYQVIRAGLKTAREMNPNINDKQLKDLLQSPVMLEGALKIFFDISVEEDVLPWMNGEFALYSTYNKDSDFNQGNSQFPLDLALLVDVKDTAKAKAFVEKLSTGIKANQFGTPAKVDGQDALYTFKPENGPTLVFGLVGKTFLFTTNSGLKVALAALNGDGVLAKSPTWIAAQKTALNPSSQFWFLNLSQITPLLKEQMKDGSKDSERIMKVLDMLDSATISNGSMGNDGLSRMTLNVVMK